MPGSGYLDYNSRPTPVLRALCRQSSVADLRRPRHAAMHRSGYLLPVLLLRAPSWPGAEEPPSLAKLEPATGQPHEVVFVQGAGREFAQIVWDAGTTSEKIIPGGYQGAFMFSVPHGATPVRTPSQCRTRAGRSNTVTFTVPMPPGPDIPRPRGQWPGFPSLASMP